jgi:hypothetical protein
MSGRRVQVGVHRIALPGGSSKVVREATRGPAGGLGLTGGRRQPLHRTQRHSVRATAREVLLFVVAMCCCCCCCCVVDRVWRVVVSLIVCGVLVRWLVLERGGDDWVVRWNTGTNP